MGLKGGHLLVTTREKKYSDFLGYEKRFLSGKEVVDPSGRGWRQPQPPLICNLNLTTVVGAATIS
jgi:hypothetical protein